MIDMFNPALNQHMFCTAAAVRVWRKYGWVPYSEWLEANPQAAAPVVQPAPEPPAPAPVDVPVTDATTADTTPDPAL